LDETRDAIVRYRDYIAAQVLADSIESVQGLNATEIDMDDYVLHISVEKV
jgi:hypothetical protein